MLFVKAEKCEFRHESVPFLGFIIEGQVSADPEKIKAVTEWPIPQTRKQLQCFLGFANFYRRFIQGFSQVVAPLTKLTSPKVPFLWSPEADQAMSTLKELFSTSPVLIHPDTSLSLIVEVDASDSGVGTVITTLAHGPKTPSVIS